MTRFIGEDDAIMILENSKLFPGPQFIRPSIKAAIDRWADGSVPFLGGFLTAVMENHLSEAVQAADRYNLITLPCIVSYVYETVPMEARRAGVATWAKKHPMKG